MTDRPPAALCLPLLALLSAACGGGGSGGPTTPSASPTPAPAPAGSVRFTVDSGAARHPISPYIYGTNQAELERPLARPAARPARRQPLDRLQLGEQRLERRLRLPAPERRLPRAAATCPARPCARTSRRRSRPAPDDRHGPDGGLRRGRQVGGRRRQPDARLPERPLPPVAPGQGPRLRLPAGPSDRVVYQDEFVAWLEASFPDARGDAARTLFYSPRQRARPLGLHPSADPPDRAADLRRDRREHRRRTRRRSRPSRPARSSSAP